MKKPSIFIGSSTEGLEFARAARYLLSQDAEITIWNEGYGDFGSTVIETLIEALPRFDFALLVLTSDDIVSSRDIETFGPRDNVIFELGLFMGHLGRARTFILHPASTQLKIPSDLAGVITARFEWPREDKSHRASVGAACDRIREAVHALGVSEAKTGRVISDIRSRQEQQASELSRQRNAIRALQIALQGIVTHYEFDKLRGLDAASPFLCHYSPQLEDEIRRLRALGLVQNRPDIGLATIRRDFKDKDRQFDLKDYFFITEEGREYLRLRGAMANDAHDAD